MAAEVAGMDIAQLVAEHHAAVYRYAYRLAGSVPDAEDLCQQVFLVAQQKLRQLRDESSARSWLFAILRNRFLKTVQEQRLTAAGNAEIDINDIPTEIPSDEQIDREQFQDALKELSPEHRVVLAMFYFEECSYREIGEKLGLPIGTVMSRLARAKAYLRWRLLATDAGQRPQEMPPLARQRG